ncbi:hypothetical protein O3M35_003267 [Rhynocoris fuscipes]|uniref:BTB domain-containing protein n=1 Tax=Rhynocoris fuscipes TaxID=488301 RepID=A0AAW1CIF3_9HEMI
MFCDVTISCEGKLIKLHKLILATCSTYFEQILVNNFDENVYIILVDVKFEYIKKLVEFMYKGEVKIQSSKLNEFFETAEHLKIKGLMTEEYNENISNESESSCFEYEDKNILLCKQDEKIYTKLKDNNVNKNGSEDKHEEIVNDKSLTEEYVEKKEDKFLPEKIEETSSKIEETTNQIKPTNEETNNTIITTNLQIKTNKPLIKNLIITNIIKMPTYLKYGGRSSYFWEISSTKRVLKAIKDKEIEMKNAANILGVTYGTLYGRYRNVYGFLKSNKLFWSEHPQFEDIIYKIQKKDMSLFKGAKLLNVSIKKLSKFINDLNQQ